MDSQFHYLCAIRWISLIHLIQQDPKPKSKKRQCCQNEVEDEKHESANTFFVYGM